MPPELTPDMLAMMAAEQGGGMPPMGPPPEMGPDGDVSPEMLQALLAGGSPLSS